MLFDAPLPFEEALRANAVRTLLPTELRTVGIDQIAPELLARSVVSAGVQSAEVLQRVQDATDALARGTTSIADQRTALKELLGSLGDTTIDNTDLTDLRSDARLNLILDTNLAQVQGHGQYLQATQPDAFDAFPAWELIRVRDSRVERDWAARWAAAGGEFYGGRMIALIGAPIWTEISRFRRPSPPFDFNSGMDVVALSRDETDAIGLTNSDAPLTPPAADDLNADYQATPQVRADWLRSALADQLQGTATIGADGVLRMTGGAA